MRCCRPKRMSCSEGCDMFSTFTLCCTILCLRDGCYEFACDSRSTHWRAPEKMFVEIVPLMQCALQYPIEERFQCHMKVMHILNDASAWSGSSVGKLCENLHLRYGWWVWLQDSNAMKVFIVSLVFSDSQACEAISSAFSDMSAYKYCLRVCILLLLISTFVR